MEILENMSQLLQQGQAKKVKALAAEALEAGIDPKKILEEGLLSGMDIIGEKFKNNEVFVPEVLIAARAMNMGIEVLKPALAAGGVVEKGTVIIGTVKGDLHDIGKNIVKLMIEGKSIKVIDLGVDVSAERFIEAAKENNADIICLSALLTTTMGEMKNVVNLANESGIHGKVKIMVGGAPITENYCKSIGADCYTEDASSASEAALRFLAG